MFPDTSVGHHRMSLYFFTLNTENKQPVQYEMISPFCSARCKLIDLGKWANDEHAIND
jgi:hypothetical protein